MEQPPYDVERKLSEYLTRQLVLINNAIISINNSIFDIYKRLIPSRGAIRKTTAQNIGNLGASFVPIVNYQTNVFTDNVDVVTNLVNGTVLVTSSGLYEFTVNLDVIMTSDNNSSRFFKLRIFNVTDNVAVPLTTTNIYIGAYVSGFSFSQTAPLDFELIGINKDYRVEIGGGDAFTNFQVVDTLFSCMSV